MLGGMSLEQAEPFWTHVSAYKLPNSLEMGNLGTKSAAKGCPGECWGRGDRGGVQEECWRACLSSKQSKQGRVFQDGIMVEVVGIVSVVPQHAALCSPVADIPSPTGSVPIFSLH